MSKPEKSSRPVEGAWTEKRHGTISSTIGTVHPAVNTVAGGVHEAGAEDTSTTGSTTTSAPTSTSTDSTNSAPVPTTGATPTPTSKDNTTSLASKPAAPQPGQSASHTLTGIPSSTSTARGNPSPSGPVPSGINSSQTKSEDPSSSLPPPQISGPGSPTTRGDEPHKTERSASGERQVNKGDSIGSTSDPKSRLKGTQDSGPVSMSGQETSHPGAGSTPVGGAGAHVSDPSSGQAPKSGKQGGSNPLNEPSHKSKEDAEDPGTGQQHVKSSGFAAQGGDFDASKPGAGVPKPFACVLIC